MNSQKPAHLLNKELKSAPVVEHANLNILMTKETKKKIILLNSAFSYFAFCITHTERDKVDDGEGVEEEGSTYNSSLTLSSNKLDFKFFKRLISFFLNV